ncbi:MAG: Lrp/AsnC family transcriptional regulator, partial [archaeon]
MSLDKIDKKILYELDNNSRQPYSKIAKKLKISKESCTYRINKLIEQGIISKFLTMVSLSSLDIKLFKLYLKLHGMPKDIFNKSIENLKDNSKINWIAEGIGCFDLMITIQCKNLKEFDLEKQKILKEYNQYIQNYYQGELIEAEIYGRNYLSEKERQEIRYFCGDNKTY